MEAVISSLVEIIVRLAKRVQEAECHSANQSENDGLREDNEKLRRKISKLQTANERLGDKILELSAAEKNARQRMEAESTKRRDAQEEAARLQEVLAQIEEELAKAQDRLTKNSNNSSKPPSSDPYGVASKKKKESKAERDAPVTDAVDSEQKEKSPNEYNTRRRSGKKPGGQLGHAGKTLTAEAVRKLIDEGRCVHKLIEVGSREGDFQTRYMLDTQTRIIVTEYRIYQNEDGTQADLSHWKNPVIYGDSVRAAAAQLYAVGTLSHAKICEIMRAQTEDALPITTGTIYSIVRKMAMLSRPAIGELTKELDNTRVVATDATQIRADQESGYVRNFSTATTDLLVSMMSKSIPAHRAIEFLEEYTGILLHHHETAMYHFGSGHGECNVHVDRYLKRVIELTGSRSALKMRSLLYDIKEAVERNNGALNEAECRKYSAKYDNILQQWREENSQRKYKFVRDTELTLINRLETYKDAHLLFMYDKDVPFDNNRSERAVRMSKVHSKVTGGFRTHEGNEMCCAIFTLAQTSRLRGIPVIRTMRQLSASECRASFLEQVSPLVFGKYEEEQNSDKA